METEPPPPPARNTLSAYRWPIALIACVSIVMWGFLAGLKSVADRAKTFVTTDVTYEFTSAIPEVDREPGGILEVATATVPEIFMESDERFTAWGWLSLGENVSEIRAPVTYRYHVKLSGPWEVKVSGRICRVTAPLLEPSLPPALHTDRMEKRTERGWGRLGTERQLAELEREITPTISRYAADPLHVALVRSEARKTVEEFVTKWLLSKGDWKDDEFHVVKVEFLDEVQPDVAPKFEEKGQ